MRSTKDGVLKLKRLVSKNQIVGYIADSLFIIGSLWLMIYCVRQTSDGWGLAALGLSAVAINIFTGAWMSIRLSPIALRLGANRAFREELFLANVDAKSYLWNRFKVPMLMAGMPAILSLILCALGLHLSGELRWSYKETYMAICWMAGMHMTPLLGATLLFRLIEDQCKVGSDRLPPMAHAVINAILGAGLGVSPYLFLFLVSRMYISPLVVTLLFFIPIIVYSATGPMKKLHRAAWEFYSFVDE